MRLMITGGAGFIGSALARHAVADLGWSAMVFDALTYAGTRASLASISDDQRFSFAHGDVRDRAAVQDAIAAFRPNVIAHLAAETHVDRSIDAPAAFMTTNVLGTQVLLDAALSHWRGLPAPERAAFRVLHVSTDEVFGDLAPDAAPFTEGSPYAPRSPYAASKAASDHLARAWRETFDLPVVISNCSNNYGPYQFPEKLIPLMIINALAGQPLPLYGDGRQVRDWIAVEDHAAALAMLAEHGRVGQTYLVGARNEQTNRSVVEALCVHLDRAAPEAAPHAARITLVIDRPGHDRRYAVDPSRIERELGWRARMAFDEGLERTVAWYRANEAWWGPLRARFNAGERQGLPVAPAT